MFFAGGPTSGLTGTEDRIAAICLEHLHKEDIHWSA